MEFFGGVVFFCLGDQLSHLFFLSLFFIPKGGFYLSEFSKK